MNKTTAKLLLRMFYVVNPSVCSLNTLRHHMLEFATVMASSGITVRDLEWSWILKHLESLHKLRKVNRIDHCGLQEVLCDLAEQTDCRYMFGNSAIDRQIQHIMKVKIKSMSRSEQATNENPNWLEQQQPSTSHQLQHLEDEAMEFEPSDNKIQSHGILNVMAGMRKEKGALSMTSFARPEEEELSSSTAMQLLPLDQQQD